MDANSLTAVGVVLAALVPGGAGLWGAANLRSSVFERWSGRVDAATAGLATGALRILDEVQREITDLRGSPAAGWQPNDFAGDPGQLVALVGRFQRAMSARARIGLRFQTLLRLGPLLVWTAAAYLVSVGVWGGILIGLFDSQVVSRAALVVTAATLVILAAVVAAYAFLVDRLADAEILAHDVNQSAVARDDRDGPVDE